jgi:DNA-binding winged helix-turn-helix (wHTH) protein
LSKAVRVIFGPFAVDPGTRQLLRGQAECHLSPKAFDLLWSLVEARPKVIDKADLHQRLWPDTFVVDGSLNVLVGQIRQALGDDAQRPRFIRTVHGIGYAFCGDSAEEPERGTVPATTRCWLIRGDRTFGLSEGENLIGRDPDSTVWLNSAGVSRRHARITVDSISRRLTLADLGSSNGTFLGRTLVKTPVELSDGAVIKFGSVETTLHLWNSAKASETKRIPRKRR